MKSMMDNRKFGLHVVHRRLEWHDLPFIAKLHDRRYNLNGEYWSLHANWHLASRDDCMCARYCAQSLYCLHQIKSLSKLATKVDCLIRDTIPSNKKVGWNERNRHYILTSAWNFLKPRSLFLPDCVRLKKGSLIDREKQSASHTREISWHVRPPIFPALPRKIRDTTNSRLYSAVTFSCRVPGDEGDLSTVSCGQEQPYKWPAMFCGGAWKWKSWLGNNKKWFKGRTREG